MMPKKRGAQDKAVDIERLRYEQLVQPTRTKRPDWMSDPSLLPKRPPVRPS